MTEVLIVLGMHRSGTSAIAGTFTKLGGSAPKNLLEADEGNERGYFESSRIMRFHDELLASAGTHWADWRPFDTDWYESLLCKDYLVRARRLFEDEFGDASVAILKDPRICRFLPFWLSVFENADFSPRVVIPVRSPLEVACSLNKRGYDMNVDSAILLWLRHLLDAEASSRAVPRSIVNWRAFTSDWRAMMAKISEDLNISWPRPFDDTSRDIENFVSSDLVHNKIADETLASCPEIHEWAEQAYECFRALSGFRQVPGTCDTLDQIRARLNQSTRLFGRLVAKAEEKGQEVAATAAASRAEYLNAKIKLDEVMAQNAGFRAKLTSMKAQVKALVVELSAVNARATANAEVVAQLAKENIAQKQQAILAAEAAARLKTEMQAETERLGETLGCVRAKLLNAEATVGYLERQSINRAWLLSSSLMSSQRRRLARKLHDSGLVDSAWYLHSYEEVRLSSLTPTEHYLERGFRKGYMPNPFFDTRAYLERNEDVRRSGMNPLLHYLLHGYLEGRELGPLFEVSWYLETNPDVRASGMNPLVHFLKYGRDEGRLPV